MKIFNLPYGITVEVKDKCGTIRSNLNWELYCEEASVLESFILAQACAGIDISTEEYAEALHTAVEAIVNNLY